MERQQSCHHCGGGGRSVQSLVLQTICYLEDACDTHRSRVSNDIAPVHGFSRTGDTLPLRNSIRHALEGLYELHGLLFRRQLYCDDNILPSYSLGRSNSLLSIKALALLRRPTLGPRNTSKPWGCRLYFNAACLARSIDCMKQKQTKRRKPRQISSARTQVEYNALILLPQEFNTVASIGSLAKPSGLQPYTPSNESNRCIETLKLIRLMFERRWWSESELDVYSEVLVQFLEQCEKHFGFDRDQTTNSIWNVEHQELRVEVFDETNVGIHYRLKCICPNGALHALDPYCPRNILQEGSDSDEELDWDEELGEFRKKKTKRPTSPAESDDGSGSGSEEEEEDPEAIRLAKDKELAETREKVMRKINEMVGLDNLKDHMGNIAARVETSTRLGVDLKKERWGTVLIGNSGTGKTKFARRYAKYLSASGVVGPGFTETSGVYLSDGGISRVKSYITDLSYSGGVLFVDNAHQLISYSGGRKVVDFMMQEMESKRGKVVFILAGHQKGIFKIIGQGNGTAALLPYVLNLKDYSDTELLDIMGCYIKKKFDGKMEVEGTLDGLYMRVASRRVARDRETPQFGNAIAAQNMVSRIWDRQSARLTKIREDKKALEIEGGTEAEEQTSEQMETAPIPGESDVVTEEPCVESVSEPKAKEQEPVEAKREDENTLEESKPKNPTLSCENDGITSNQMPAEAATLETQLAEEEKKQSPELITGSNEKENTEGSGEIEMTEGEKEEPSEEVDPADYLLTKEDILGPDPSEAILDSPAWNKIQKLTGLDSVKHSIRNLFEVVKSNYQRELEEKPLLKLSLNRLFLGPPGTGKTVVAKLYAQILVEIGALSKGEVIIKNPSDLIGQYIGDSEANTKAALNAAVGNVLVVDEAHMMYTGSSDGTGNESDCYRQAMIDTIVAEVQSVPGEDRAVLLLGYEDKMEEMLQNTNPGLSRRFPLADAFRFENFSSPELESILHTKLEEHVLEATPEAIKVAMDVLDKARSRMNFGNGGEVENLISKAKTNHQGRTSRLPQSDRPERWIFEPQDFDPEHDRGKSASINLQKLFSDVIGCEDIIKKFSTYQRVSQTMKARNLDPKAYIPTNFVFKGPPGTGKTTTARKVAQVYYDMGFLSEASVVECSASDLVGKYIGHTGPKTTKVLEKALGKVLLIDEAYRLAPASDSAFTTEAVSELVNLLAKPRFHGNLIVILAGYENEMNHLLSLNPGLASRFPNEIHFTTLSSTDCLKVLKMKLEKVGIEAPVLGQMKTGDFKCLVRLMGLLAGTPLWGNARDVETLAKTLTMTVLGSAEREGELACSYQMVVAAMEAMLQERRARTNAHGQIGLYI